MVTLLCAPSNVAFGIQSHNKNPSVAIPPHKAAVVLFNGTDLHNFDSYLKDTGINNDPTGVFRVENGSIHVAGRVFGFLITKQAFQHYYLRAEFKWGEGTFAPRVGHARDSGILYNIQQGEPNAFPQFRFSNANPDPAKLAHAFEFQIMEGSTGDIWLINGASLTGKDGRRMIGPKAGALAVDRFGKGVWKNVTGYRDPTGEVEKPHGEWNVLELATQGNDVKQYVNGKLVNEGTNPDPASGKILLQSEGAEVYFRNIVLYPLKTSTR